MPGRREYSAELVGTALLLLFGLSAAVFNFSSHSPMPDWVPNPYVRRLLTALCFAGTATAVVYSPLGRRSGAHINPAVTLAFLRMGKITRRGAAGYIGAQVAGALAGAALVRAMWGRWATSIRLGATLPGRGGAAGAVVAEVLMTGLLVTLILHFVDRPALMPFTGVAAGSLVVLLVVFVAPVSGTSLNPARSLGPAVLNPVFRSFWIYLVAPPAGALAAVLAYRRSRGTVRCAKLFHDNAYGCHFVDCRYMAPEERLIPPRSALMKGAP